MPKCQPLAWPVARARLPSRRPKQARAAPLDSANGAAIDHDLGAVDRGGAVRGEVGDEVGDLMGIRRTPDRDATEAVEDDLP